MDLDHAMYRTIMCIKIIRFYNVYLDARYYPVMEWVQIHYKIVHFNVNSNSSFIVIFKTDQ